MSDIRSEAFNFLENTILKTKQDVQIQHEPSNAFKSIFKIQSLDNKDSQLIEELILDNCNIQDEVEEDTIQLKQLTIEVRGILKEGALLLGEKIYKARDILKKHNKNKNSFTEWLKIAFNNSRSTAYNALSYYEFHNALPNDDLKELFKKFPHKAAYLLSTRNGEFNQKLDILRMHHHLKSDELIDIIEEAMPLPHDDQRKRKDHDVLLVSKIRACLQKLSKRKGNLTHELRVQMGELRNFIDSIII